MITTSEYYSNGIQNIDYIIKTDINICNSCRTFSYYDKQIFDDADSKNNHTIHLDLNISEALNTLSNIDDKNNIRKALFDLNKNYNISLTNNDNIINLHKTYINWGLGGSNISFNGDISVNTVGEFTQMFSLTNKISKNVNNRVRVSYIFDFSESISNNQILSHNQYKKYYNISSNNYTYNISIKSAVNKYVTSAYLYLVNSNTKIDGEGIAYLNKTDELNIGVRYNPNKTNYVFDIKWELRPLDPSTNLQIPGVYRYSSKNGIDAGVFYEAANTNYSIDSRFSAIGYVHKNKQSQIRIHPIKDGACVLHCSYVEALISESEYYKISYLSNNTPSIKIYIANTSSNSIDNEKNNDNEYLLSYTTFSDVYGIVNTALDIMNTNVNNAVITMVDAIELNNIKTSIFVSNINNMLENDINLLNSSLVEIEDSKTKALTDNINKISNDISTRLNNINITLNDNNVALTNMIIRQHNDLNSKLKDRLENINSTINRRIPNKKEFMYNISRELFNYSTKFEDGSPNDVAKDAMNKAKKLWNELVKAKICEGELQTVIEDIRIEKLEVFINNKELNTNSNYRYRIRRGEVLKITTKITPEKVSNSNLSRTIDDESIIKLNKDNNIVGVSPGLTMLTISTSDGTMISKNITVEVIE